MKERIIFLALAAALLLGAFALAPRLEGAGRPGGNTPRRRDGPALSRGRAHGLRRVLHEGRLGRGRQGHAAHNGAHARLRQRNGARGAGRADYNRRPYFQRREAQPRAPRGKTRRHRGRGRARLGHTGQSRPREPGRGALRGRRLRARGQRHGGGIRGDILGFRLFRGDKPRRPAR